MPETTHQQIAVILATGNRDKVKELRPLLEDVSPIITVFSLDELGIDVDVEETEETLEGNALLKARALFSLLEGRFPFMITLADDTGLEVTALDGAPGVYSARYAPVPEGATRTYSDNVNYLLHTMQGIANRHALFKSVIAMKGILPSTNGTFAFEKTAEGVVDGSITLEPIGDKGFGYDPIFRVTSTGKTYSEMSIEEKNLLSHRALAVRQAIALLHQLLEQHTV